VDPARRDPEPAVRASRAATFTTSPARKAAKEKAGRRRYASRGPAKGAASITSAELSRLGVPSGTVQYWLKTGVLLRTGQRGVYTETPRTRERLEFYRANTASPAVRERAGGG